MSDLTVSHCFLSVSLNLLKASWPEKPAGESRYHSRSSRSVPEPPVVSSATSVVGAWNSKEPRPCASQRLSSASQDCVQTLALWDMCTSPESRLIIGGFSRSRPHCGVCVVGCRRIFASLAAGLMAGVLGVTGWIGFAFFIVLELLVSRQSMPSFQCNRFQA